MSPQTETGPEMANAPTVHVRWKIPARRVEMVKERAAVIVLDLPPEIDPENVLDGGHVAISTGGESRTSYFAVMSVDRPRRSLTLYVKRSSTGVVSAALLDPAGAELFMAEPRPGIDLPAGVQRPMFIAAGSGLASGLGLLRRRLRQSPVATRPVPLLFVGDAEECGTVRAAVAAQHGGSSVELRLWDTGRRGRRVTAADVQRAAAGLQADWIYVCGPEAFTQMVGGAIGALPGPVPQLVVECHEARRKATGARESVPALRNP